MSVKDDYDELKRVWSALEPLTKVLLAVAFASSVLSLASLADNVFALKGFLSNTIDFYRNFTKPIANFLSLSVKRELSELDVDAIVLLSLVSFSHLRGIILNHKTDYDFNVPAFYFMLLCVWLTVYYTPETKSLVFITLGLFVYKIFAVFLSEMPAKRSHQLSINFMVAVIVFVGALAAVSEGLSRTG